MSIQQRISICALVGLIATAVHAQAPTVAEGARVSPLSRTTVFVRDIEESLELYSDILGLQPRRERMLEGEFWNVVVGAAGEDRRIRVVILNTTEGERVGNVGLFQFVDENDGPPVYKPPRVQAGDVALIMLTKEILQIYKEVRDAGYTIIAPPMNAAGDTGPDAGYEMLFFDRDGIIVNLIQSPK